MRNQAKLINIVAALFGLSFLLTPLDARSQSYPNRPIRLIIPYPPGGGLDIFGRSFVSKMGDSMGQPIVVENRPGASTIIGAEATLKSPADGYTFMLGDMATFAVNPLLYKKLSYDPFRDFAPISLAIRAALVMSVNTGVPANSIQELVAHLKSRPGQLNYGSPGAGSPHHLAMEMFKQRTGVAITHVAYKGGGPAIQDLLPGQIQLMFLDLGTAGSNFKSGKIRALGVGNPQRLASMNDVPTIAESGVTGFDAFGWGAIAAPAGTPTEIIARLNTEFAKATADPAMRQRFADIGFDVQHSTPEGLMNYMKAETEKWAKVIKEGGISIE